MQRRGPKKGPRYSKPGWGQEVRQAHGPGGVGDKAPVRILAILTTVVLCGATHSVLRVLLLLSHLPYKPILRMGGD